MPKKDFPMYEAVKQKFLDKGLPKNEAQERAAKITHWRGKPVPPSHPKKGKGK